MASEPVRGATETKPSRTITRASRVNVTRFTKSEFSRQRLMLFRIDASQFCNKNHPRHDAIAKTTISPQAESMPSHPGTDRPKTKNPMTGKDIPAANSPHSNVSSGVKPTNSSIRNPSAKATARTTNTGMNTESETTKVIDVLLQQGGTETRS